MKNKILAFVRKLGTTSSLLSGRGKHRTPCQGVVDDVRECLIRSPKKSQETGYSYSMCHRAAKSSRIKLYKVMMVQELQDLDRVKQVDYCEWFLLFINCIPNILEMTWFTDEAWFDLSR
ncbi:hypothetical protein X975_03051, partial [Stegodyphus mimosarum]